MCARALRCIDPSATAKRSDWRYDCDWFLSFNASFGVTVPPDSRNKVRANSANTVSLAAIVIVSAQLGTFVSWSAPGIDQYIRDWMIRARGLLPPPDDIVIVAIDEPSIARFGRFPWSRSVSAHAIDASLKRSPTQGADADEVWYDPGSNSFYFSRAARKVEAWRWWTPRRRSLPIPLGSHSVAVNANNKHVFVPVAGKGIFMIAPNK